MLKYALITGASAGIGLAFAEQLAAAGWSLVLVARRETQLAELATKLNKKYQVDCRYWVQDLSATGAAQTVFDFCERENLNVAMLVNNAGYGVPGDFDSVEWNVHHDMLQLMLNSVVELTYLFYPAMKQNHYGRIIHVASLAGITPATAGHTLYGATKSFLVKFGHALHLEAKEHGVHVTTLCPGFTYTEFHDVNGTRSLVSQLPKGLWITADEVVRQGLQAVEENRFIKLNGWRNKLIYGLTKVLPDTWMRALISRKVGKFRQR